MGFDAHQNVSAVDSTAQDGEYPRYGERCALLHCGSVGTAAWFVVRPPRAEPGRQVLVLCDLVIEPALDGLAKADMAKIVEHCFRQAFAIGEIEQPPPGMIWSE